MIERETITVEVLHATCGRCGHKWDLKRGRIPVKCPACFSPYWNAERKHKPHEPRAAKPPRPSAAEIEAARAERTAAARARLEAQRAALRGGDAVQGEAWQDYWIGDLGRIRRIVMLEDLGFAEAYPEQLACSIETAGEYPEDAGEYTIATDKIGRVRMGYINIEPVNAAQFKRGSIGRGLVVTVDPILIATLYAAIFDDTGRDRWKLKRLSKGSVLLPVTRGEARRIYREREIPRPEVAFPDAPFRHLDAPDFSWL